MNFSDITSFSGQAEFSPSSEYLALVKGIKLSVFESSSMASLHSWNLIDQVSKLEWSCDSTLIMCSQNKRGLVQVFNVKELKWECKITLGPCGLSGAWLAPDSRHILTVCQFQIRVNIWSLLNKSVLAVSNPKFPNKGLCFSKCGRFTAILKRFTGKDSVVVLDSNYAIISDFPLKTMDTENIMWTNDNYYIIAYDQSSWLVYSPAGELVYEYSYPGLLISKSYNSPHGSYSAISASDKSLKLLHHITWAVLSVFQHSLEVSGKDLVAYNEVETLEEGGINCSYTMLETPIKLVGIEEERNASIVKWSHNDRYIACKFGKEYLRCKSAGGVYLGLCGALCAGGTCA